MAPKKPLSTLRPAALTHLLVDLDGTLLGAHDFPLRIEFTTQALAEIRKHGTWVKTFRALRAVYTELGIPSRTLTNGQRAVKVFSELLGLAPAEAERLFEETVKVLFPKMERHFFAIHGAIEFLHWAKSRYKLILATNPVWTEEIVKLRMRWAKIDPDFFISITHADKMHACKPCVEYYQEILEQENIDSSQCFLIGNDLKKDLPAAKVGIPTFILTKTPKVKTLSLRGQTAPVRQERLPTYKIYSLPEMVFRVDTSSVFEKNPHVLRVRSGFFSKTSSSEPEIPISG